MKFRFFANSLCLFVSTVTFAMGSSKPDKAPPAVANVSIDLVKYQGQWLEAARLPNWFQRDCLSSEANYTLLDNGDVSVVNKCNKSGDDVGEANGRAWSTNAPQNTKLKVRFFWPFSGDYWILALDKNYQWVIVGSPDYKYLWILVRKIPIDGLLFQNLLNIASDKGYDLKDLIVNPNIQLR